MSALNSALSAAAARASAACVIWTLASRQAIPRPMALGSARAVACGLSEPCARRSGGTTTPWTRSGRRSNPAYT